MYGTLFFPFLIPVKILKNEAADIMFNTESLNLPFIFKNLPNIMQKDCGFVQKMIE